MANKGFFGHISTLIHGGAVQTKNLLLLFLVFQFHLSTSCKCKTSRVDEDNIRESRSNGLTTFSVDENDKVWLFAVDGRRKPYSFFDANGQLVGFDVDLISKVCGIVQKKCKMVLSEFTECTITNRNINYPGRGLMSGWFDGCPGYVISEDRKAAFDFTEPYLETDASFTVAPGNPKSFDPDSDDYSGFTLTHLTGAVTNAKCLDRLKKKFGNIIIAADLPEAKALLLNRTADALFSPRTKIDGLEVLPQRFHCEEGGTSIMLKKGSQLSTWWNSAFKTFVMAGGYPNFCSESETKYNATFRCLPQNAFSSSSGGLVYDKANVFASFITTHAFQFQASDATDPKVWLFAVSGRRKPFNYLDDQGQLTGFDVDFVDAVCKFAGKTCVTVLSEFTECTFTERNINYPGRGLMDGWFDACTGYADSIDREDAFDFTDAYLKSDDFYSVVPGNPSGFDPDAEDFSDFTLTHLTGAYTNAACLNRLGKKYGKIIIAANLPEGKALLFDGKADVLFSPRSSIPDLESLPQAVHCERTGTSMMTKKGSQLVEWWNQAFRSFVQNGLFQKLCQDGSIKYNYPISCMV